MADFGIKAYKSYVSALKEMFGLEVKEGDKVAVEYNLDRDNKTVSFFGKFPTSYKITSTELMPFVYQHRVEFTIADVNGANYSDEFVVAANKENYECFEMARQIFNVLLGQFREETVRVRMSDEDRKAKKLGQLVAKFLNKGMTIEAAKQAAEAELEAQAEKAVEVKEAQPEVDQAPAGEEVSLEDIAQEF